MPSATLKLFLIPSFSLFLECAVLRGDSNHLNVVERTSTVQMREGMRAKQLRCAHLFVKISNVRKPGFYYKLFKSIQISSKYKF